MKKSKPNNMMLQTVMRFITIIVFAFSFYLFFAGHNAPGGGFIGGLMTASAILVLYLVFDRKEMLKAIPLNFTTVIGIGLLFAAGTGIVSMLFDFPFLTHFFDEFRIPFFGDVELTTALSFDLGVYLVVVGAAMSIILVISGDEK